jgi:hypothetical protein
VWGQMCTCHPCVRRRTTPQAVHGSDEPGERDTNQHRGNQHDAQRLTDAVVNHAAVRRASVAAVTSCIPHPLRRRRRSGNERDVTKPFPTRIHQIQTWRRVAATRYRGHPDQGPHCSSELSRSQGFRAVECKSARCRVQLGSNTGADVHDVDRRVQVRPHLGGTAHSRPRFRSGLTTPDHHRARMPRESPWREPLA